MSEALLVAEGLRLTIDTPRGPLVAVDGVDLEIGHGETLALIGESGSGKTMLTRSLMGLVPPKASVAGRVLLEGRDVLSLEQSERRELWGREVGLVFQDPMTALNPVMRVGQQVAESLRVHLGKSRSEARKVAVDLLGSLGVPEAARRFRSYPNQLSGGQRQRVAIAIALACGPKLLLADEPTTSLDVTIEAQILDLIASEQERRRMALLLVTHNLALVAQRVDRVAVMYAGRIVEQGPTESVYRTPRMHYTRGLLSSVPRLEHPVHRRLDAIPGMPPDLVSPPPGCRFADRCPNVAERCLLEEPPLVEDPTGPAGHSFRCWHPSYAEVPEGTAPDAGAVPAPGAAVPAPGAAVPEVRDD
jgi:peptide/nickel transport system ATP-binding protein